MQFDALAVNNLRCLEQVAYAPAPASNLVLGANGSGKTSLLEAFALASWGKSFQSNRASELIHSGAPGLVVNARLSDQRGLRRDIQVRKRGGETHITLDGQAVAAASTLAQQLPLVVINSKAADILTESPSNRRALVDRTMFHVEHDYVRHWKAYRQALRQRNGLIRRQAPYREVAYWDAMLVSEAEWIDQQRERVVVAIDKVLAENALRERLGPLTLAYAPGWKRDSPLGEQLQQSWERDCRQGYTSLGIHRADLSLRADGRVAARRLSRGQGKYIVVSVLMALAAFIHEETGQKPVILVDDLAAELDDKMRGALVDIIDEQGGQRVYTAIRAEDLPEVMNGGAQVFHVEHPDRETTP